MSLLNIFVAGGLEIMGGLQDLSKLPILYQHYTVAVLAASTLGALNVYLFLFSGWFAPSTSTAGLVGEKNTGKVRKNCVPN